MLVLPTQAINVITHKSVSENVIDTKLLRRIYSMRQQRWANNSPIVVFVLPSQHPIHIQFAKETLNIFPYKLDRIWNKLTFSGLGVAPTVVNSQAELIQAVRSTPGAIGYVETIDKEAQVNVIEFSL